MTIDLPDDASPKVIEAMEEVMSRVRAKFTGRVVFDFKGGVPLSVQCVVTRRLGVATIGRSLTAGDTERTVATI